MAHAVPISHGRSSHRRCSVKKGFLEISPNLQENTCARVSFFKKVVGLRPATFFKKETVAQVFSCEFGEIFTNTFFKKTPPVAVPEKWGRQRR